MDYQSWEEVFNEISKKSYFKALMSFLDEEYSKKTIFPPKELIFNAFKLTPLNKVKVVIFGQDPYPNPNEAMGLAFSVNKGIKVPPSLVNIFKEIKSSSCLGCMLHCILPVLNQIRFKQHIFLRINAISKITGIAQ